MFSPANDIVPLSQARSRLSDLIDDVRAGAEKIITRNGEGCAALIDVQRLDYYHRLEREHIHLQLLDAVSRGLDDVSAGRITDANDALDTLIRQRQSRLKK